MKNIKVDVIEVYNKKKKIMKSQDVRKVPSPNRVSN